MYWTDTQILRFKDLGLNPDDYPPAFDTPAERNRAFQKIEKQQVRIQRMKLAALLGKDKKTRIQALRERLESTLFDLGFTGVTTPTIISRQALRRMSIDAAHPLNKQVFWISDKQCLRPMLAPNLYSLMKDFSRLKQRPLRFFEIGSCFRKESSGRVHASEFTMLNLVEMGLPLEERQSRLEFLANAVMTAAGINDYDFETDDSQVYGTTLDVVAGPERTEVSSGASGPHPLDAEWGITDTWVGMGFGLERLLMISQGETAIGRWSKSLTSLDGIRLKI
ncbi:MAG TPA: pyrrolysine--tRNA(Pyl) ligase large subunit [Desulfobacteraceae bacterium]|nr:pyrrolysine--tRNA(Pyl) ligase large subunit [Desulfobacteraceae bacterium]|tara:strand:+ start:891 stop:1727 length:837 start_codon:yes stop_codon:yes gene_type:complete